MVAQDPEPFGARDTDTPWSQSTAKEELETQEPLLPKISLVPTLSLQNAFLSPSPPSSDLCFLEPRPVISNPCLADPPSTRYSCINVQQDNVYNTGP